MATIAVVTCIAILIIVLIAIDITTVMPKYPSTETLDKCDTRELNRRQRMYYQEKELILTEKLALAENAYFTRESLDMTLEQA